MAHKDVEWAYTVTGTTASEKAVLIALAHCRNAKTGRCFPSQKTVSKMTSLSLATVRRALDILAAGELINATPKFKGRNQTNTEYSLNHTITALEVLTATPAHTEHRSDRADPVVTVQQTSRQGEHPDKPTGIEQEDNRKVERATRGTRIPEDFTITPDMVNWARENAPLVDGKVATATFIDHWKSATRNAIKRDWSAAWRNWLRKDQEDAASGTRRQTPDDRARATLALVTPIETQKAIS
jgi:pyocin large subunit-like protein